jgi:hypothetical protein
MRYLTVSAPLTRLPILMSFQWLEYKVKVFNVGQLRRTRALEKEKKYVLENDLCSAFSIILGKEFERTMALNISVTAMKMPRKLENGSLRTAWRC